MKALQRPSYQVLPVVERKLPDRQREHFSTLFPKVLDHFPELAGETITVAMTHENCSWAGEPYAMADPFNRIVYVGEESSIEPQTLFHELTHLLIRVENDNGADHPKTSEEYCSIYAVSKMPPDMVYRDHISYLGEPDVPNARYPEICTRALEYRENNRDYIKQCKEWLEI